MYVCICMYMYAHVVRAGEHSLRALFRIQPHHRYSPRCMHVRLYMPSYVCMYVCMYVAVNAADILNDNQGGREFYAAFAKLEDFTAVSKLWDILQVHTYIHTHT